MFSEKQMQIIKFPYQDDYDFLIADGAIRSGKTSTMTFSFILWSMNRFNNQNFIIAGKTVKAAYRNIIVPIFRIVYLTQNFKISYNRTENILTIKKGKVKNTYYVFGGKDESSYTLVQGLTAAGAILDEVALMPKSFVDQVIARCSILGSKIFFNCNPEKPTHFFKTDWIDKAKEKKALYLHFDMNDNPSLSEEIKERYRKSYTGVFYQRYILGRWVNAEGAIYRIFIENEDDYLIDEIPENEEFRLLVGGVDFGGSKSKTAFVTCAFSKNYETLYILKSKTFNSSDLNTLQLQKEFSKYVNEIYSKYHKWTKTFCDSAEPMHIRDLQLMQREEMTPAIIQPCLKEEINFRIECFNMLLAQKRVKIIKSENKELIQSLKDAVWDEKKSTPDKDVRLDDGSYCVDLLDALEYSYERWIPTLQRVGFGEKIKAKERK